MIRLLAMDLDETLLGSNKHVSAMNAQALQKARDNGIHTVIATGRPWFSFAHTLDEMGTRHLPDEYSITLNGGALVQNEDGSLVSLDGLDFEEINMLFHKGLEYEVGIHVYTEDKVYAWNLDEDERDFLKGRLETIDLEVPDLFPYQNEHFVKILYKNTDVPYLEQILEDLGESAEPFDVSFSSSRYLEFNKKGVSKGEGLKRLANLMGLDLCETAAIGDHANDLSMIRTAGVGMAVANAIDEVKAAADYITPADHNHGAIAQAVDYLLERNRQELETDRASDPI